MNKQYLGDGVYIETDGYGWTLTTENGVQVTNTIYLEPPVYIELVRYVEASTRASGSADDPEWAQLEPPDRSKFPYCPKCWTNGHEHRKDCPYAGMGMTHHTRRE